MAIKYGRLKNSICVNLTVIPSGSHIKFDDECPVMGDFAKQGVFNRPIHELNTDVEKEGAPIAGSSLSDTPLKKSLKTQTGETKHEELAYVDLVGKFSPVSPKKKGAEQ